MIQAFEREPSLRQLEVDVILVAEDEAGPYALLNDTVLYQKVVANLRITDIWVPSRSTMCNASMAKFDTIWNARPTEDSTSSLSTGNAVLTICSNTPHST